MHCHKPTPINTSKSLLAVHSLTIALTPRSQLALAAVTAPSVGHALLLNDRHGHRTGHTDVKACHQIPHQGISSDGPAGTNSTHTCVSPTQWWAMRRCIEYTDNRVPMQHASSTPALPHTLRSPPAPLALRPQAHALPSMPSVYSLSMHVQYCRQICQDTPFLKALTQQDDSSIANHMHRSRTLRMAVQLARFDTNTSPMGPGWHISSRSCGLAAP